MLKRVVTAWIALIAVGSLTALAGDSSSGSGHFTNHISNVQVTEMPDGSMVQMMHYSNMSLADDPKHPSFNTANECVGELRINAAGVVSSGAGSCFAKAVDGHGFSYWWQVEKAGTADCPNLCGTWGYFGGYGRFEGLQGQGSWKVTASFEGTGDIGTWTNTYSMP